MMPDGLLTETGVIMMLGPVMVVHPTMAPGGSGGCWWVAAAGACFTISQCYHRDTSAPSAVISD
jgi:hypothetical protein